MVKKGDDCGKLIWKDVFERDWNMKTLKNDSVMQRRWYQHPKQGLGLVYGSTSPKRKRLEQKKLSKKGSEVPKRDKSEVKSMNP